MHIQDPEQRAWIQAARRAPLRQARRATSSCASCASSTRPRRSRRSCRPSTSARSASRSRAASRSSRCWTPCSSAAAEQGLDEVVHRHGAPRPPQRARQHRRQVLRPDLPRVRGRLRGRGLRAGLRRREVPPRHRAARSPTRAASRSRVYLAANPSHLEAVNPVLEGIVRAKQDMLDRDGDGLLGAAGPDARRRGVRRPGRRRRDAQPVAAARLPHRRHDPRRRQQPGRLHHRARSRRARRSTRPTSRA